MRHAALTLCALLVAAPVPGQDAARSTPTAGVASATSPASAVPPLDDQERFLSEARVTRVREVSQGITGTLRATLTDGTRTHDASIQTVNESKARHDVGRRVEFNFRDYWGYNVAAYRLAVMLGLDMVPASVPRKHRLDQAAYTWWVDDVLMDEVRRVKTNVLPPQSMYWSEQIRVMRVFDALIGNTDRNQGNMLIDRAWKLWLIDHTRAFRLHEDVPELERIRHCERSLFARLKALTLETMRPRLEPYLTEPEMKAVLARRDRLVSRIESLGPNALFDLRRP